MNQLDELKSLILEKENAIIDNYVSLGKLYYNIHKDDEMPMFKELQCISQLQSELQNLEKELEENGVEGYVPSKEANPVADFYPEDSMMSKSQFLYQEIMGLKEEKEEAVMNDHNSSVSNNEVEEVSVEDLSVDISIVEDSSVETSLVETSSVETSIVEDSSVETSSVEPSSYDDNIVNELDASVEEVSGQDEISSLEEESVVESQSAMEEESEVESQPAMEEETYVVNPFAGVSAKTEVLSSPVFEDHTETYSPKFQLGENGDDADDSKTEVLSSNLFEDEKTSVLNDNFVGLNHQPSFLQNDQDFKTVPQNPFGGTTVLSDANRPANEGMNGYGANPYGNRGMNRSMNQPVFNNGYQNPQNGANQGNAFVGNAFNNPAGSNGAYQTPFGKEELGKTQPLSSTYTYNPMGNEQKTNVPQVDSAIDNEATMILDPFPMPKAPVQPKMQPEGNTIHCKSCGKDAPNANFCIFCGAKLK